MKVNSSRKKSNFASGDFSSAGITIDKELAEKYRADVVEQAKQLKAKHGTKYSDEYYLTYAKNIDAMRMKGAYTEIYNKRAGMCPIQDPDWAGYSYEEVLQMENNGYKIPEEVLLWAHAQQESDVTAYEVISDDASVDDNSSTEEITGDSDINNLQKKAKQYITKSENAQNEAQQKIEEFKVLSEKAQNIKEEKENSYKDSMKEIMNLTNEWKQLDTKSKNDSLSNSEQKRYTELGKILGNNGSATKSMQVDSDDLDKLLSTMNLLNEDTAKDLTLAQDTTKAGVDLANFKKGYNDNQATHNTSGVIFSNMGILDDILYGVSGSTIQRIAIDTGRNLETFSNEVSTTVNSRENTDLSTFASEYTAAATEAEQYTKNTMGDAYENTNKQVNKLTPENSVSNRKDSVQNNKTIKRTQTSPTSANQSTQQTNKEEETKDNYGKNTGFYVLPFGGRPAVAIAATVTSAISTANLKNKQSTVNETEETLQKNLKKSQANIKKLKQEVVTAEKKHNENLQKAEEYSMQLEDLDAKTLEAMQASAKQKQPVQNTKKQGSGQEETQAVPSISTQNETSAYQAQTEVITSQIASLAKQDNQVVAKVNKPMNRSNADIVKDQKANGVFNTQNTKLTERNKNNKKVSVNTIICGTMTIGVGTWNMVKGVALLHTPWTAAIGAALCIYAGVQLGTGAGATAAGSIGVASSNNASDDIKDHDNTIKEASRIILENRKAITDASKAMRQFKGIAVPKTSSEGTQNNNNNTQAPAAANDSNSSAASNNTTTSRTETKTFTAIKDINNIPAGPTNLSNPLNDTKKNQNNITDEVNTQKATDVNTAKDKENAAQKSSSIAAASSAVAPRTTTSAKTENPQNNTKAPSTTNEKTAENKEESKIQTKTASEGAKDSKENIKEQLKTINNKNQSTENESDDKISDILKKNINKSKVLQEQFAALNNNIQNVNTDNTTDDITSIQEESENTSSDITNTIDNGDKTINMISKNSDEESDKITDENIEETKNKEQIPETDDNSDDTTLIAASATTNANVNKTTITDDKASRKLERFNNDSIIESKKKKKKVMAISASSGGSVNS